MASNLGVNTSGPLEEWAPNRLVPYKSTRESMHNIKGCQGINLYRNHELLIISLNSDKCSKLRTRLRNK
jgi:hypothetical protein